MRSRAARNRRRIAGLLPMTGRALLAVGRWFARHPQPWVGSALLAGASWALWHHAQSVQAFRVARVELPAQSTLKPPQKLLGANLWDVDLQQVAADLRRQEPSLKDVRVVRQLPNAIRIEPVVRVPIAQLRTGGWHPVDHDGFVLPESTPEPAEKMVRFTGVERNDTERIALAVRVLDALRRSPLLARHVTEINVAEIQEIRFLLDDETEVRCGSETELGAHLDRLRATLRALAKQSVEVAYIDVRFQEPVVGPKQG